MRAEGDMNGVAPGEVIRWLGPWQLDRKKKAWRRRFVTYWWHTGVIGFIPNVVTMEAHRFLTIAECPHLFNRRQQANVDA